MNWFDKLLDYSIMDQVVRVLGDLRFLCIRIFLYQEIYFFPLGNKPKISGLHAVVIISQLSDLK